ncbi:MAG: hypothetical protein ACJAQ6_000562 [Arenicella sp.]|jgi:hypothetical protein
MKFKIRLSANCIFYSSLLLLSHISPSNASVVEVGASLSSGQYFRGVELADDGLTSPLSFDFSDNNGLFAGFECYQGDAKQLSAFKKGCVGYTGYFEQLNTSNALSMELRRYDYASRGDFDWDTNEVSLSWHYKSSWLTLLSYSDNWLASESNTVALDVSYRQRISDRFSGVIDVGILRALSIQQFNSINTVGIGIEYQFGLWSSSVMATNVDSTSTPDVPLDFDQAELRWSIRYQLY